MARYYNGAQGQFLSEDPVFLGDPSQQNLQDPQSLNAYSYANNNPVERKDPTGRQSYEEFVGDAAIELTNVADTYIDEGVAAVRSAVGVSNTSAPESWEFYIGAAPESLQSSVGWPSQVAEETSPINWNTSSGLLWPGSLSGATLLLFGTIAKDRKDFKEGIEPFSGMGNVKNAPTGSIWPKSIPHAPTADIPATIGRPQPQFYISAPPGTNQSTSTGSTLYTAAQNASLPATVNSGGVTYYRNSSGLLSPSPGH
jgi:hypothetical protein